MSPANQESYGFTDRERIFLEDNDLMEIFAESDENEGRSLIENVELLHTMGKMDLLDHDRSMRILEKTVSHWRNAQSRPTVSLSDIVNSIVNIRYTRKWTFSRLVLPAGALVVIVLALLMPTIKSLLHGLDVFTVSSFSGSINDSAKLSGGYFGIVIAIAAIIIVVISRRKR